MTTISLFGGICAGIPSVTVTAVKFLGRRVNHHRFDFFPYVEFVRAITPIDVLHLEMSEGGGSTDGTPTSPFRIPTAHRL